MSPMMTLQMQHMHHMLMTSSQQAAAAAAHARHGGAAVTSPAFIRNLFGAASVLPRGVASSPLDLTCSNGERVDDAHSGDVTRDASDDDSDERLVENNPEIFLFGRNRCMTSQARRDVISETPNRKRRESDEIHANAKRERMTYDDVTPPHSPEVDPVGDD